LRFLESKIQTFFLSLTIPIVICQRIYKYWITWFTTEGYLGKYFLISDIPNWEIKLLSIGLTEKSNLIIFLRPAVWWKLLKHRSFVCLSSKASEWRVWKIKRLTFLRMSPVRPSVTSNSILSFNARELKFCIQMAWTLAVKVIGQIFKILFEGWDMRIFLSLAWRMAKPRPLYLCVNWLW